MSIPALFLLFCFLILPFFLAFGFALTNQRLISPNPPEFVGWRNFNKLLKVKILTLTPLTDERTGEILMEDDHIVYPNIRDYTRKNPDYPKLNGTQEWFSIQSKNKKIVILAGDVLFIKSLLNTMFFALIVVPFQAGLALYLALLINKPLKGINIFRTIYFVPVVISMVVVSILWSFIYDGQNGLLNTMLGKISFGAIKPVDWLGNTKTAMLAIIFMSVWQGVGYHMIIWLAGLQNIPSYLYEAAAIEGAGPWHSFKYVTWPGLRNTYVFVMVTITIQAFGLFTQINVMTRGGPLDSTSSVIFQMVIRGYEKQDIAGGSAISVIFFIMVVIVALVQRYITREKN